MSQKIFIVSPDTDSELIQNAIKLLTASGKYEVQVEKNTPANLLHIALGLMSGTGEVDDPFDDSEGDLEGQGEAEMPDEGTGDGADIEAAVADSEAPVAPEGGEEITVDVPSEDEAGEVQFNFESLGVINFDGELIEAFIGKGEKSILEPVAFTTDDSIISYKINESTFSFHGKVIDGMLDNSTKVFCVAGSKKFILKPTISESKTGKARLLVGSNDLALFK